MKNSTLKFTIFLTICVLMANKSFSSAIQRDTTNRVYKVNRWISGIFDAGAGVANIMSINRVYAKPVMTDADFLLLNKNAFSKFDQRAFKQNFSKINTYETYSNYTLGGTVLLPLILGFDKDIMKNWKDIMLMYVEMHMITYGFYNFSPIGPTFVNKYRPIVYYDQLSMDQRRTGKYQSSFYSGHVASTAGASFFMAKVYCDYHPALGWKKYLLYGAATLPPLLLSDFRVKALRHFPSDNMVGLGVGMLCGIMVPEMHKNKKNNYMLSMFTTQDANGLTLKWTPDNLNFSKINNFVPSFEKLQ